MVWPAGIEPATPRVSGGRSTGLSYGHIELARLESKQRPCAMYAQRYSRHLASPPPRPTGRARLAQGPLRSAAEGRTPPSGKRSGEGQMGEAGVEAPAVRDVREAILAAPRQSAAATDLAGAARPRPAAKRGRRPHTRAESEAGEGQMGEAGVEPATSSLSEKCSAS
jgi:hypothetical protein